MEKRLGYRVIEADGRCQEYRGMRSQEEALQGLNDDRYLEIVEPTTFRELKQGSIFYPKATSNFDHTVVVPWQPLSNLDSDGRIETLAGGPGIIGLSDGTAWNVVFVQVGGGNAVYKWTGVTVS